MDAARQLVAKIAEVVRTHPDNRAADGRAYFDAPLVGFAAGADPLFEEYKSVIGPFHWTPREAFEAEFGAGSFAAGTVVSWVLPIVRETRVANRREARLPCRRWAHTRAFGETFNDVLRREVAGYLGGLGSRAVAPVLVGGWRTVEDPAVGIASAWSERHAAYAAGLGTFSLNDALITERGIAHRLGSVVTDLVLPPTPRTAGERRWNCLRFRDGSCGACIDRCPAGALSDAGHDKGRCRAYTYGEVMEAVGSEYGVTVAGCGLCQTAVPCEQRIPPGR